MFCICAEHTAENVEIFLFLLNSVCTELVSFLLFALQFWQGNWRCLGGWAEETQLGQVIPSDQRVVPDHMTSYSYEVGERRRRTFAVLTFLFPSHCKAWWSPAVLEMAEHIFFNFLCHFDSFVYPLMREWASMGLGYWLGLNHDRRGDAIQRNMTHLPLTIICVSFIFPAHVNITWWYRAG